MLSIPTDPRIFKGRKPDSCTIDKHVRTQAGAFTFYSTAERVGPTFNFLAIDIQDSWSMVIVYASLMIGFMTYLIQGARYRQNNFHTLNRVYALLWGTSLSQTIAEHSSQSRRDIRSPRVV